MPRRELLTEPQRLDRYTSVRKFAPLLLTEFEFNAARATADLMGSLDGLRDLNATGKRMMPDGAPTGFVKPRWRPHVIGPEDTIDRHFYELCTLAELRDRLRARDVWVRGSRQYRDFETYLIPTEAFASLHKEPLALDIATDLSQYMDERRECLQAKMDLVAGQINLKQIQDHWQDILRLLMPIKTGAVTASVILRKLAAYPRQNGRASTARAR